MFFQRLIPILVLSLGPCCVAGHEDAPLLLGQAALDELYFYADFPELSELRMTHSLRITYNQVLSADPLDIDVLFPSTVMVQPLRARADWESEGLDVGSWIEDDPEPVIAGLTPDFFLEGQLPTVPVRYEEDSEYPTTEVMSALQPVIEAAVEDHFNQISQRLVEGADVYTKIPYIIRTIEEALPAEIDWSLEKAERDGEIIARACFSIEDFSVTLCDGNLKLPGCSFIPQLTLLTETFEELLSLQNIDQAEVAVNIHGALEGRWNPKQLLEHDVVMNFNVTFECETTNNPCKLEVDLHRQLSSRTEQN